jgi:replicative DNA helicase
MSEYRRITKSVKDFGKLIPATDDPYKHIKTTDKDWYLSVYKYTEDHKKQAEKNGGSIRGITDVITNQLVFDVDCEKDLEKARKDCIAICERLDSIGIPFDKQNIAFSGGKGFSVVVEHNTNLTPEQHKSIAESLAGDLETFDTSNYNASRIFRLNHTKHNKTGLYKTPLSFDELKESTIDQIKEVAQEEYDVIPAKKTTLPQRVLNLQKVEKKEKKKAEHLGDELNIDFSKKPYYLTDLKYVLQCGYIPPGMGNEGMMVLCATYRHVGMDKTDAYHLLKSVNEKRADIYGIEKRTTDEIWEQVITTVYSSAWKGGTYTVEQSALLEEIAEKFNITENSNLVGVKNLQDRFMNFAQNLSKNVIKTGIKDLDQTILLTPGMMVGLLAAPSAGKTSVATTIVETQARNDQAPQFLSMDMHDNLLTQRLLQRLTGKDFTPKIRKGIEGDKMYDPDYDISVDPDVIDGFKKLDTVFGEVDFDFTRGCTIESIEENIRKGKAKHGDKFKVVVVDYLEKVRGPYSDATANSGYVASRLSDLATTYDVLILLLLQPQKSAGDPSEELTSMRKVKGASVIEQDCRVILTMWRPGFNPQDSSRDRFVSIAVVKNNMGPTVQLDFLWNGVTGQIDTLPKRERHVLEDVIQCKKEAKEAKKKEESNW